MAWSGGLKSQVESGPFPVVNYQGGFVKGGQRVAGVPWRQFVVQSWGTSSMPCAREWGLALWLEGGGPWHQSQLAVGGSSGTLEETGLEWQVRSGLTRWPEVDMATFSARVEGAFWHVMDWGTLRIQLETNLGHGRSWFFVNDHEAVALGTNSWEWRSWWCPNVDGSRISVPAVGWASDGRWCLAWNSTPAWLKEVRLWDKAPGNVHVQLNFPDASLQILWRVKLMNHRMEGNASTSSPGKFMDGGYVHEAGMSASHGERHSSWDWEWRWNRKRNS